MHTHTHTHTHTKDNMCPSKTLSLNICTCNRTHSGTRSAEALPRKRSRLEDRINPGRAAVHTNTLPHRLTPSRLPARLPSYYLSVGSRGKMQMFVSLKMESVNAKLRAICKNRGTNSLKCLHGRERRVSARGLTDCSIRKPMTPG